MERRVKGRAPAEDQGSLQACRHHPVSPGGYSVPDGGQSCRRIQISQLLASVCVTCDRASAVMGLYKTMVFVLQMGKECLFLMARET